MVTLILADSEPARPTESRPQSRPPRTHSLSLMEKTANTEIVVPESALGIYTEALFHSPGGTRSRTPRQ